MSKVCMMICLLALGVCVVMAIQKNSKASITHQPFGYQMCIQLCGDLDQCHAPKFISTKLMCVVGPKRKMLESCDAKLATQNCAAAGRYSRAILTRTKGLRSVEESVRKPDGYPSAGVKTFFMTTALKTWDQGLKYCKARGGTLAMPKTKDEQHAILQIIHRKVLPFVRSPIFFGLRDIFENGTFLWTDGQALSYTNWVPGQPSYFQNNRAERCACFRVNYGKAEGWTDDHCEMIAYFVCQKH